MPFITANGTILSIGVAGVGHFGINGQPIPELEAVQAAYAASAEGGLIGGAVLLGPSVIMYQRCGDGDPDCRLESFNLITKEFTIVSELGANAIIGSGQGDWAAGLVPRSGPFYRDSLGRRVNGAYVAGGSGDDYTGKWCAVVSYNNDKGTVILDKYGNVTTLTDGVAVDVHLRNDIAAFPRGNQLCFSSGERSTPVAVFPRGHRHTGKAASNDLWVTSYYNSNDFDGMVVWKVGEEHRGILTARNIDPRNANYYSDIHEYANGMLLFASSRGQGDSYGELRQCLIDPVAATVNGVPAEIVDLRTTLQLNLGSYGSPINPEIPEETQANAVPEGPDPFTDDYVPTDERPTPLWQTALKGITPQLGLIEDDIVYNLAMLAENVLQPIKNEYPNMVIRSGFRQVNSGISAHERGHAADIQIENQTPELLFDVANFIAKELRFDQLILNYSETPAQSWIHVSFDERALSQTVKTRDYDDTFHDGLHLIRPLTGEARAAKHREYEAYAKAITDEIAALETREDKLTVNTVYADALVDTFHPGTGPDAGFSCGAPAPIPMPEDGLSVVTRIFEAGRNGHPWDLTNPDYEAYNGCGQFVEAVVTALPATWGHLLRDGYAPEAFGHAVDAVVYKSPTPLYNDKFYQLVYIIENPGQEDAAPFWLPTCQPTGDSIADAPQGGWTRTPPVQSTVAPPPQMGYVRADITTSTWSASTGSSLYATIDDVGFSDDTDYIESDECDGLLTIQLREEFVLIAEWTEYRTAGLETYEYTVTEDQWRTVSDWSKLSLWFTVNETETAKFAFQDLTPPTHGSLTLRVRLDMGL